MLVLEQWWQCWPPWLSYTLSVLCLTDYPDHSWCRGVPPKGHPYLMVWQQSRMWSALWIKSERQLEWAASFTCGSLEWATVRAFWSNPLQIRTNEENSFILAMIDELTKSPGFSQIFMVTSSIVAWTSVITCNSQLSLQDNSKDQKHLELPSTITYSLQRQCQITYQTWTAGSIPVSSY